MVLKTPVARQATLRRLSTALRLAGDSTRAHKLRSALTLIGVVIGVGSVVLVGAAIEGLGAYAEDSTAKVFGTESFMVGQILEVGRSTRTERAAKLRRNKRFQMAELDYLRQTTGDALLYSPYRVRVEDVKHNDRTYEGAAILGVSAALADIREVAVEQGRFITEQEERNRQNVCVIGNEIWTELFRGAPPLGEKIKIRGLEFTVVGVQERLGAVGGRPLDNQVYIPAGAFTRLFGPEQSMPIFGRPRAGAKLDLEGSVDLARAALRTRFRTRPGAPDNFDILTPDSIRSYVGQILAMVAAVVVPVTLISLVVGGIVIMNIMLVSVTERTREIGIRKSVGARRGDIQLQFLTEAVLLAVIGGVLGLLLGWAGAEALGIILEVKLPVTLKYVALAVIVSTAAGVLSGWYPAMRAARLDPVAALRAE